MSEDKTVFYTSAPTGDLPTMLVGKVNLKPGAPQRRAPAPTPAATAPHDVDSRTILAPTPIDTPSASPWEPAPQGISGDSALEPDGIAGEQSDDVADYFADKEASDNFWDDFTLPPLDEVAPATAPAAPPGEDRNDSRAVATMLVDVDRSHPAFQQTRTPLPVGARLEKYEVTSCISDGGFALVYEAQHHLLESKVVVKENFPEPAGRLEDGTVVISKIYDDQAKNENLWNWFEYIFSREARALSRLRHENIVRLYDYARANNTHYIIMEHVDGDRLSDYARNLGPDLNEQRIRQITAELCKALDHIHASGLIHLDVKPANIIIERDSGRTTLVDFGSALAADDIAQYKPIVTPGYSPPELYGNATAPISAASDIYALGATLYSALTGNRPPDAQQRQNGEALAEIQMLINTRFRFSDRLYDTINRSLALDPAARPASAQDFYNSAFGAERPKISGYSPQPMGDRIFLSYRRGDKPHFTGRLLDRLSLRFGENNVFHDASSIEAGVDFWKEIRTQMSQCAVIVPVIGPDWLQLLKSRRKSGGGVTDYVTAELKTALDLNLPVIPVLVDGAAMPAKRHLPKEIRQIADLNAIMFNSAPAFHSGAENLIAAILAFLDE